MRDVYDVDVRNFEDPDYNAEQALRECYDCWASGAWPDSNAIANLEETMLHVAKLLDIPN